MVGQRRNYIVGDFLGSDHFQNVNCEGTVEKVCTKLSRWKYLLSCLIVSLWHKLMVLQPPVGFIDDISYFVVWTTLDSFCCFFPSCSRRRPKIGGYKIQNND